MKIRVDKLLLQRGVAASRERAQALILAGKVLVQGQKIEKAGTPVDVEAEIRLLGEDLKYVSRGGLKLERALQHWQTDVAGKVCMDVGASTNRSDNMATEFAGPHMAAVMGMLFGKIAKHTRQRQDIPQVLSGLTHEWQSAGRALGCAVPCLFRRSCEMLVKRTLNGNFRFYRRVGHIVLKREILEFE